jgi:hypothetical protein
MATIFAALDKRMNRDTEALHDHLWHGQETKDPRGLLANLQRDARDADAFLRLRGKLRRNADALIRRFDAPGAGESLFELIEHTWGLAAAMVLAGRGDSKGAAVRSKNVATSASIGICANAGCFEYVEEWEAGKVDFETYSGRLADFLEAKGISGVGQFKRLLNAVWDFSTRWDASASRKQQELAAKAAIADAGWCLLASVAIRSALGRPPQFSTKAFEETIASIVATR